jgi:hypothetical protein
MDLQSIKTLQYPLRRGKHHELSMPRAKAWLYITVATRRFRNDVLLSYLKSLRPPRAPNVFHDQTRGSATDLGNKFAYLPKLSIDEVMCGLVAKVVNIVLRNYLGSIPIVR